MVSLKAKQSMLTVVIPTYNERRNLQVLLPQLLHQLALWQERAEVLIVDDASPDGTQEVVHFFRRKFPHRLRLLARPAKKGLGSAYRDGFLDAIQHGAHEIVQMDADGSHDLEDIPRLLSPLRKGTADLSIGSRYVTGGSTENWPVQRRVLSRGAGYYVRAVLAIPVQDATAGFRAWTREGLVKTAFTVTRCEGYAFQVEMLKRALDAGVRTVELPITFRERTQGRSKLSGKVIREAVVAPWLM